MERREAERREAISGAQAIYHQAASLSGLEVTPDSARLIGELAGEGFYRVEERRRPEAVANLLRVVASALDSVQAREDIALHERDAHAGQDSVCPVYPFD